MEYHGTNTTTLSFYWDYPPQGIGPETVVENYTISISSSPLFNLSTYVVQSPPWNVTLAHNEIHSINITAVNCIGDSGTFIFPTIEYSKFGIYIIIAVVELGGAGFVEY